MTPFQAVYGQIPMYHIGTSPVNEVDLELTSHDELLRQLKMNLQAANNRMQQIVNSKRRDIKFNKGEWVFLKLQPYRQHIIFKHAYQKLACRLCRPFQIIQRIGPLAYKLQQPVESRVRLVFHVSMLRKKLGIVMPCTNSLPDTIDQGDLILQPTSILDTR